MSLLDSGSSSETSTPDAGANSNPTQGEQGATVDSLNQEFQAATDGKSIPDAQPKAQAPWMYDENKPGEGERPEWLKEKYKSAVDQAKAYNELDKKLGKFKGAPDEYDLTIPDMPDFKFEQGDPILQEFLDFAKESNASQEFVSKTLAQYIKGQQFYAPNPDEEMAKLGVNAKVEINQLSEWASQRLTKEEHQVFKSMVTTADAFRVLQKLKGNITSSPEVAVKNDYSNAPKITEREVHESIADPRFNSDPNFRKEVEAKAAKLWG